MFLARVLTQNWQFYAKTTFMYSQDLQSNSQLNKKVTQSTSWKDFMQIYQRNKKYFNSSTFNNNRVKIEELLNKEKEGISFKFLSELTQNIIKTDINALNEQQIINLASILRTFQSKGLNPQIFHKFHIQLLEKYSKMQISNLQSTTDISKMMQAYELFNFFKWYAGCKPIMERLFKIVNPSDKPNLQALTKKECLIVMRCISQKQDLNTTEKKVRSYLLQSICQQSNKLQQSEVIQWLALLMKMEGFDFTPHDSKFINILIEKLATYGSNLQYQQALKLVEAQSHQIYIFLKVYDQVSEFTFQKISKEGTTSSKWLWVLNLLRKISGKFKFQRLSETNKQKLYKFLQNYGKQLQVSKNLQQCMYFFESIKELIKNNFTFYDSEKTQQIVQLMLIDGIPVNSSVLFPIYLQKIDISPFIQTLLQTSLKHKLDTQTFQHILLVEKIYNTEKYHSYKPLIQTHINKYNPIIAHSFKDTQIFTSTFNSIFQNFPYSEVMFSQFHRKYPQFFNSLVNPFEVQQSKTSNLYKIIYSQYIMFAYYTPDMIAFFKKYQNKMKSWLISKLINRHYSQKHARMNLLAFCLFQLQSLNQYKNRDVLQVVIFITSKYHRFAMQGKFHRNIETLIFKLANSLFKNIDSIQQLNLQHYFLYTMEKYFIVNHKNYHNQINYRNLLKNALQVLERFKGYKPAYLIRAALRLNILTKDMLKGIDIKKLGLYVSQKHMVSYLINPNYVPKIDLINFKMLVVILHNPNMSDFISKNIKDIISQISKCHSDQLFQLITVFNQPRANHTREVILALLQNLVARQQTIQKSDFVGALDNLIKQNYYFFVACRQLIQKIVTHIQPRIPHYSLWTHERVMNFIISQSGYKTWHYFQKLVQYYENNQDYQSYLHLLYILSKTSHTFKHQQTKHIKPLLQTNLPRGVSLFLATEALIANDEVMAQILAAIARQTKNISHKWLLSKLQYDYLKLKYPEYTKQLCLSANQLYEDSFSVKPQNQTIDFLELLAKQHNTKTQMLTQWGSSNYIVKIKNWVFSFYSRKRQNSMNKHNFINRALKLYFEHTNKDIVSISLGMSKNASLLSFLKENYPQLVDQSIFDSMSLKISEQQGGNKQSKNNKKTINGY